MESKSFSISCQRYTSGFELEVEGHDGILLAGALRFDQYDGVVWHRVTRELVLRFRVIVEGYVDG